MDALQAEARPGFLARTAAFVATLATAALAICSPADALIYWGNGGPGTIGRADLDGTHVEPTFIAGGSNVRGVAVTPDHIYWSNWGQVNPTGTIGRADLDGTGVNQGFITGSISPYPLAVGGSELYWGQWSPGRIGRGGIDGTGVTPTLISVGSTSPTGVAVDAAHIYWGGGGPIGRANLDGTAVQASFIPVSATGVAVDATHIYWADPVGKRVGRATLAGTDVQEDFITGLGSVVNVAVDDAHVYWATLISGDYWIGRANIDGGGVDRTFIPGTGQTIGLAVDDRRYPTADAGPDQSVESRATVTLDGAGSTDANGEAITFAWTQMNGPPVQLNGADTATPGFTAPAEAARLAFELTVCDPVALCDTATTAVTVAPPVDPPPAITGLKVTPRRFTASPRRTDLGAKAGTRIKLAVSEDARVRFRVRRDPQRRRSSAPPQHPHVFKRELSQGKHSVAFTGTLGARTFRPGAYRLIARARDGAGQASDRVDTAFEILP